MVDVSRRQIIRLGAVAGASTTERLDVPETLTPGLSFVTIDPSAFHPYQSTQGRAVSAVDGTSVLTLPGGLMAPIDVPVGAVIKEITFFFLAAAATPARS